MSAPPRTKALFLDRDGVINVEYGYVYRREDFHFREGIFELCHAAQELDYLLVVVTNQAGIGRGYYTESEYLALTEWMVDRFAEQRVRIAHVYYCPYHPIHGVGMYKRNSPDRKPNPGMMLRARADFGLDLQSSVLVGDQLSDIRAGNAAGVGTTILLGAETAQGAEEASYTADHPDDVRRRFFSRLGRARGSPPIDRRSMYY